MAQLPQRFCAYPGCGEFVRGDRYCPEHKTIASREYDKRYRPDHSKHYGTQWRKIRERYVSKHPLCERCLEVGRYVPVAEVHHIVPIDDGGTHAEDNLVSLCRSCHGKTRTTPTYVL